MDDISALTDEEAVLKASLQFMIQEQDDIKDHVATCKKNKSDRRQSWPAKALIAADGTCFYLNSMK